MEIAEAAERINELSDQHSIGKLQILRQELRGRQPRTFKIFSAATIFEDYAFHDGGRHELQFNIGIEKLGEEDVFRYGVAFSLEPSRSHTDVSELFPKIDRFNYYMRTDCTAFPGYRLWCWSQSGRSPDHYPRPFEPEEIRWGNFLFFGKWVSIEAVDFNIILNDLDALLPLYVFVEKGDYMLAPGERGHQFRPGCTVKKPYTSASPAGHEYDVALRHNVLQLSLYSALCKEYGTKNVATEFTIEAGGRVDAATRYKGRMAFFEIKVAPSARSALRESLGQLLEYAHWPDTTRANELVVVGEAPATADTIQYLKYLRLKFGLKVFYRQLDIDSGNLLPSI